MKNKILKKILGLFGYKLIEKNIIKNDRLLSSKSYLTIEKILEPIFEKNKINFLIQIGANDGERFDVLNYYIKKYKTKSLLVEPINENYESLKKNYQNCDFITFDNSAISVNKEVSYLYKVNPIYFKNYGDHIPGITSFDKNHLLTHGVKKNHIIKENVQSTSIGDLIVKHNVKQLDLLFVDAEGYDGKIVYDFLSSEKIEPIIVLEYIHIKNEIFKLLINKLEEKKYVFFSIDENMICFPEEKKNLLNFIKE